MRLFVCGVDAEGHSCLSSENEVAFSPLPGAPSSGTARLFSTDESPPPASPPGSGKFTGGTLPPGHVNWFIMDHKPRAPSDALQRGGEMHYRNAIDLIVILQGNAELILRDGEHTVEAGDCIVMPGSDHGLRAGPDGCRLMSFAIGTPMPA